jgi:hypothetical protein
MHQSSPAGSIHIVYAYPTNGGEGGGSSKHFKSLLCTFTGAQESHVLDSNWKPHLTLPGSRGPGLTIVPLKERGSS